MINLWKFLGLGVFVSALFGCVWSAEGVYVTQCMDGGTPEQLCLERWYQRQAEVTGDTTWCGLLSDRVQQCVLQVATARALAAENPADCTYAEDAQLVASCRDSVHLHLAAQRLDTALCDEIEVEVFRTYCRDVITPVVDEEDKEGIAWDQALPPQWEILRGMKHAAWCDVLAIDARWQCLRMMYEEGVDISISARSFCRDFPTVSEQGEIPEQGEQSTTSSEFCLWFSYVAS